MEHETGDEKYECVMLNSVRMEFRILVGNVYCESLSGSLLENLYLYL